MYSETTAHWPHFLSLTVKEACSFSHAQHGQLRKPHHTYTSSVPSVKRIGHALESGIRGL